MSDQTSVTTGFSRAGDRYLFVPVDSYIAPRWKVKEENRSTGLDFVCTVRTASRHLLYVLYCFTLHIF
jgi:hypothetical protein